ncbi:hypothetical protein AT15_02430 [Kosmotoga arenicorallina S304]|uniref:tRNA-specific 2-thiouridylase MnmA n=1 Tax=Kosmotoga arenicorallina S304 TaxID=1453497 RepID=A0A176K3W1_9BACT|nr:tRNA 2-thiouridine(34) synthase MnmA [Kosmotoga arenicorallina]OAA31702.1 hypothetical protein AT15_02430 [Kosmotoga arenicorallina S304]
MKIGVAMSGGVDSAVAAALLIEMGHEVVGYHMKNLPDSLFEIVPETKKVCCSPSDTFDAFRTAKILGIELKIIRLDEIFRARIIDYFTSEYKKGRTPNPCVLCNDYIKFGALMEKALEDGMELFASGHYARIIEHPHYGISLAKGKASHKDQAYFLSMIKKEKLSKIFFPVGELTKEEIREKAKSLGLPVHQKRESQELCFIPDNDYRRFLSSEGIKLPDGDIVDIAGNILGKHHGLAFYTIGQRRGLGISSKEKLYVIDIDTINNRIIVGPYEKTLKKRFTAAQPNWLIDIKDGELRCQCMIRSTMKPEKASVYSEKDRLTVEFDNPVSAITPGQLAVFYVGDVVLGSAFIESVES